MTAKEPADELAIFQAIVSSLAPLKREDKVRLLRSVTTFLHVEDAIPFPAPPLFPGSQSSSALAPPEASPHTFSKQVDISPKDFLLEKDPQTDVEKATCLAYYLAYYRDTPHFRTLEISKMNTEAAHRKFTNAAQSMKGATGTGLLVPAGKSERQLSAMGEQFVQALPDRERAREILQRMKPRRTKRRTRGREPE